jgi:hypothetical protein
VLTGPFVVDTAQPSAFIEDLTETSAVRPTSAAAKCGVGLVNFSINHPANRRRDFQNHERRRVSREVNAGVYVRVQGSRILEAPSNALRRQNGRSYGTFGRTPFISRPVDFQLDVVHGVLQQVAWDPSLVTRLGILPNRHFMRSE